LNKRRILALAAGLTLAGGMAAGGVMAGNANASSFSCVEHTSCGGAVLAYRPGGVTLALAVLQPDSVTNGGFGYWNEPVGFNTEDYPDGTGLQDFYVAQLAGEPVARGGQFGLGEYAVIYAPGGKLANDPVLSTYNDTQPATTAYCLSVQDLYRHVRGRYVQRWATVLRPCSTYAGGPLQDSPPVFAMTGTGTGTPQVTNPDPYQLWAPVEVAGQFLEFQDIGLDNSSAYRHGYAGENFVLDDTASGGPGTQGLAYQENDGLNQKFTIFACTLPVTDFNSAYYNCPNGAPATTAPTP
jgi:hypothetical protein